MFDRKVRSTKGLVVLKVQSGMETYFDTDSLHASEHRSKGRAFFSFHHCTVLPVCCDVVIKES